MTTRFPPFPPRNRYILPVGRRDQLHDVLLSMRWSESEVRPRHETATREVVAFAMEDVLAHAALHDQYVPLDYEVLYKVKDAVLQRLDRMTCFTWELWEIVLKGAAQFGKAYEGLWFVCNIYLGEKSVQHRIGAEVVLREGRKDAAWRIEFS